MTACRDISPLLDELVDGTLDAPRRHAVEAHLRECASCRAELEDVRRLLASVGELPVRIEPPRDLWPGIDRAVPSGRGAVRVEHGWVHVRARVLLAAAAALVLLSVGGTVTVLRTAADGAPAARAEASLPGELGAVEARLVAAARELALVLETRRDEIDADAVRVVEQNVRVIDRAIREARAALAGTPDNSDLAQMLWATHRRKIDLLQRANRL